MTSASPIIAVDFDDTISQTNLTVVQCLYYELSAVESGIRI